MPTFVVNGISFEPCTSLSLRQDAMLTAAMQAPALNLRESKVDDADSFLMLMATTMECGVFSKIVGTIFKVKSDKTWSPSTVILIDKLIDDPSLDKDAMNALQEMFLYCCTSFFAIGLLS